MLSDVLPAVNRHATHSLIGVAWPIRRILGTVIRSSSLQRCTGRDSARGTLGISGLGEAPEGARDWGIGGISLYIRHPQNASSPGAKNASGI